MKKWCICICLAIGFLGCEYYRTNYDTSYDPYTEYALSVKDQRGKLLSQEFVKTVPASEINRLFPEINENVGDISGLPEYDINLYKITYTSVYLTEIIE